MSVSRYVAGSPHGRAAFDGLLRELNTAPDVRLSAVHVARRCGELIGGGELFDEQQVRAALRDALVGLSMQRSRVEKLLRREVEYGLRNPQKAPADGRMLRDRGDVRDSVLEWWSAVEAHEWVGRRGASALKVLAAVRDKALRAGKLRLAESYRELAAEAAVGVATVQGVKPLIAPFLRVVELGSVRDGTRTVWQLVLRRACISEQSAFGGMKASGLFGNAPLAANQWHGRSTMWRLYGELDPDEPQFRSQLARTLGVNPSTVTRNMRRLVADGLAVQNTSGGWLQVPFDLALEYDGPDFAAQRVARHRVERELYLRGREQRRGSTAPRRSRDDAEEVA